MIYFAIKPMIPKFRFFDVLQEFSQHGLDASGCVYIAWITIIANNHWLHFTEDIIKELLAGRPKVLVGGSGSNPGIALRKLCQDINIIFRTKIEIREKDILKSYVMFRKGWMGLITGPINIEYINDIKDGSRDDIYPTSADDPGHARVLHWDKKLGMVITETHKGILPSNTFKVKDWRKLVDALLIKRSVFFLV